MVSSAPVTKLEIVKGAGATKSCKNWEGKTSNFYNVYSRYNGVQSKPPFWPFMK